MAANPNRRPAGTSAGGQFAPGAHPESGVTLDVAEVPRSCYECGAGASVDENGVSNHLDADGNIDYDADAEHVAIPDDDYAFSSSGSTSAPPTRTGGAGHRERLAASLRDRARDINGEMLDEIRALRPLGRPSELSAAMGLRPKRGQVVSTPLGYFVFAKDRSPSRSQLDSWAERDAEAGRLFDEAAGLGYYYLEPGRTVGNQVALRHAQGLRDRGLLDEAEAAQVAELERFWAENPDASWGVVDDDGRVITGIEWEAKHR